MMFNIFKKRKLVPYNYELDDCHQISVGDTLYSKLDNEPLDYIAGLCGMSMQIKKGSTQKWKVLEASGKDILCENKRNRMLLQYLNWSDGNMVTVPGNLAHSTMKIRFFIKEK